jgi:hypothetical protein
MKEQKRGRASEERPPETAKRDRLCCSLANLGCANPDCIEDIGGKIGYLWLMISLT